MDGSQPLVSVVMATYNRANIIGHSIQSLQANTIADWELIVVGDCCTDDTADVVSGFADPRIRFVNLPRNCGEQSGPNNEGARLARGRYIAFLNHDDLWFPGHLEKSLAVLEKGADLVFGLGLGSANDKDPPILIGAATLDGNYHPTLVVPASLWVTRRELMDRVGPMRPAGKIFVAPSQDWLHRCWKSGARLAASNHLAAVLPFSAARPNAYGARLEDSHVYWAGRMRAPDFPVTELIRQGLYWDDLRHRLRAWPFFRESLRILGRRFFAALGIFPPAPSFWLRYGRRGSALRHFRKRRGLPPHADILETQDEREQRGLARQGRLQGYSVCNTRSPLR